MQAKRPRSSPAPGAAASRAVAPARQAAGSATNAPPEDELPPATAGSSWSLFLTAHAVAVDRIEAALAQAGLPPLAWYDALWALERAAERRLRMSEFEAHMVISRSNITRLVDRLEDAGLVTRERAEEDRRGAFARLTEAGAAMRRRMWVVYGAAIRQFYDRVLDEGEHALVAAAMRRVLSAARDS